MEYLNWFIVGLKIILKKGEITLTIQNKTIYYFSFRQMLIFSHSFCVVFVLFYICTLLLSRLHTHHQDNCITWVLHSCIWQHFPNFFGKIPSYLLWFWLSHLISLSSCLSMDVLVIHSETKIVRTKLFSIRDHPSMMT